jgi:trimethylamine--corrinoid protein Co-methyltransferase
VTLLGSVVQHTAESLSGVVIHQLAREGSPIVWGGSPAVFDMREGTTPMGAVETWMIDSAYVQVGKALSLPTHAYLGMSDSKIVDAQCGLESMGGALVAGLSGVNMISGAGMMDFESCVSFEKLVIDAEIIGMTKHLIAGMNVRDNPIALDLMRKVGHKGDFLAQPHTRKWYKSEQYLPSAVLDRANFDVWKNRGAKSAFERARARIDELLPSYQPSPLTEALRKELRDIAQSAASKFGMGDLPLLPKI